MLHPFVSTPGPRSNPAPVLTLSTSVHVVLLYLALASTEVARRTHVIDDAMVEEVQFSTLPFRAIPSAEPRAIRRVRSERRIAGEAEPALPPLLLLATFALALPESAPMPEYQPGPDVLDIGGSAELADDVLHLGVSGALPKPGTRYNAYDDVTVEKRVVPAAANRSPQYPARMLTRGIEANFNVTFVVDTTGTVDQQTVELPPAVQQEFASAVVDVLFNWRFAPAELGGRRVRQRVLQPFTFRLERAFSSYGRP